MVFGMKETSQAAAAKNIGENIRNSVIEIQYRCVLAD